MRIRSAQSILRERMTLFLSVPDAVILTVLFLLWSALSLLVNPFGQFPLNDDWAYAASVRTLLAEWKLDLSSWNSATFVGQAFWGALFCLPFGFSFHALRLSTLVAGYGGLAIFYILLRKISLSQSVAFFGVLVLAFNPIYFELSHTFMTDVPFLAITLASIYFFFLDLEKPSTRALAIAGALSLFALLIRQVALLIPAAYALTAAARFAGEVRKVAVKNPRPPLKQTFQPLIAPILTLVRSSLPAVAAYLAQKAIEGWLMVHYHLPIYFSREEQLRSFFAQGTYPMVLEGWWRLTTMFAYLIVFLFPFSLLAAAIVLRQKRARNQARYIGLSAVLAAVFAWGFFYFRGGRMPLLRDLGNIIETAGLGPSTLVDAFRSHDAATWLANWMTWSVWPGLACLLCLGGVGASAFSRNATTRNPFPESHFLRFLLCFAFLYMGLIVTIRPFDRYYLPVLPIAILAFGTFVARCGSSSRGALVLAALALAPLALFSIAGTHDYLAWNRARWKLLADLQTEKRITPEQLDGGFEFNGFYLYSSRFQGPPGKSWWWVRDDEYIVSFRPKRGYVPLVREPYSRWFPPMTAEMLISRREKP